MFKKLQNIFAWMGLLIVAIGLPLSFSSSAIWISSGQIGSGFGYYIAFILGVIGTILAIWGGLIIRSRYFQMGVFAVGLAYIASFYGWIFKEFEPTILLLLLPGILLLTEGVFISTIIRKKSNRS